MSEARLTFLPLLDASPDTLLACRDPLHGSARRAPPPGRGFEPPLPFGYTLHRYSLVPSRYRVPYRTNRTEPLGFATAFNGE